MAGTTEVLVVVEGSTVVVGASVDTGFESGGDRNAWDPERGAIVEAWGAVAGVDEDGSDGVAVPDDESSGVEDVLLPTLSLVGALVLWPEPAIAISVVCVAIPAEISATSASGRLVDVVAAVDDRGADRSLRSDSCAIRAVTPTNSRASSLDSIVEPPAVVPIATAATARATKQLR